MLRRHFSVSGQCGGGSGVLASKALLVVVVVVSSPLLQCYLAGRTSDRLPKGELLGSSRDGE
jgi:hypothetical protein